MPESTVATVAEEESSALATELANTSNMAMAIWFNQGLFDRARLIAKYLAGATGFVPEHLLGKTEACFAVVSRALVWKLDPFAVAQSTYSPGAGKVGYEGKLCQAILEASGKISGGVRFTHYWDVEVEWTQPDNKPTRERVRYGTPRYKELMDKRGARIFASHDWTKIQGKFDKKRSEKGRDYAVATWDQKAEIGLGVQVLAQVKGELEPRTIDFDLVQAFPRNSTLWATDPKTQICYTAVRRFASVAAPALFMGVPFDDDVSNMRDITPEGPAPARPTREAFADSTSTVVTDVTEEGGTSSAEECGHTEDQQQDQGKPAEEEPQRFAFIDSDGESWDLSAERYVEAVIEALDRAPSAAILHGLWETNSPMFDALRAAGETVGIEHVHQAYSDREDALRKAEGERIANEMPEVDRMRGRMAELRDKLATQQTLSHVDMTLEKNRDLVAQLKESWPYLHRGLLAEVEKIKDKIRKGR